MEKVHLLCPLATDFFICDRQLILKAIFGHLIAPQLFDPEIPRFPDPNNLNLALLMDNDEGAVGVGAADDEVDVDLEADESTRKSRAFYYSFITNIRLGTSLVLGLIGCATAVGLRLEHPAAVAAVRTLGMGVIGSGGGGGGTLGSMLPLPLLLLGSSVLQLAQVSLLFFVTKPLHKRMTNEEAEMEARSRRWMLAGRRQRRHIRRRNRVLIVPAEDENEEEVWLVAHAIWLENEGRALEQLEQRNNRTNGQFAFAYLASFAFSFGTGILGIETCNTAYTISILLTIAIPFQLVFVYLN